jgi:PfaB family protein
MKEKIAIIGMSSLFPGSKTLQEFWNNLMDKKDLTGMATKEDFGADPELFYKKDKGTIDRCYSLRGGYIRDYNFNSADFGSEDLNDLDQMYQWGLQVAKDALMHGGYWNKSQALDHCGVIFGNLSFPTKSSHKIMAPIYTKTLEKGIKTLLKDASFEIPATAYEIPKNNPLEGDVSELVKNVIGLKGTNFDLDAACASSLYAIKMACDELLIGKADMMLAGAVCSSDQLFIHMGFSILHAYAGHDHKYSPLDKDSAGLVSSEGAGMILMKRLSDAEKDGDNIIGVISGIGLSNDGGGKYLLSPNPKGQTLAYERAYNGTISKENTSYIECHATGTPLGDVTEINSLETFFGDNPDKLRLGSVKSNIGHMLTAAGMPSLMKVLLSMEHHKIPPGINLSTAIQSKKGWFTQEQIIEEPLPWETNYKQAAVNSFGFGGTNAHLVVESHHKEKSRKHTDVTLKEMAITSMEVHFGDCVNLDAFYQSIFEGTQHFSEMPIHRWKGFEKNNDLLSSFGLDTKKRPRGNFIADFDMDLMRYKIQPNEVGTMEPQQALILKVADQAIQKSSLKKGENVAVLIAMNPELAIHHYLARWDSQWQLDKALDRAGIDLEDTQKATLLGECRNILYTIGNAQTPSQHTSFVGNIMSSRISALWDFNGPSFTITNGNNGTTRALEVAQNMLSLGEVDAVVVGAVEFSGGMEAVLLRNLIATVNQNKQPSLSFNADDYGWLIGEGASAIVLKANETLTEKDTSYATIDAIGDLSTGKNIALQELVASGFKQEDDLEQAQLLAQKADHKIALGSVKTNIGHTFAAAGLASVVKTALCLYHQFIPGIPNWKSVKNDALKNSNYYFPSQSRPWVNETDYPREALVNLSPHSRVKLSEVTHPKHPKIDNFLKKHLFVLKGNTQNELREDLSLISKEILDDDLGFIAQAYYDKAAKTKAIYSIVLVASSQKSLRQDIGFIEKQLAVAFDKKTDIKLPSGSFFSPSPSAAKGDLAFVYPGSATSYEGLGQDLFQFFPNLLSDFENKIPNLIAFFGLDYLFPKKQDRATASPNIQTDAISMMSAGVLYSTLYTHILRAYFGVKPKAAMGYSMGECSSMWYSFGIWNPGEGTKIFRNSPIFKNKFSGDLELLAEEWNISTKEAKARWQSWILLDTREKVEAHISKFDKVFITFVNSEKELIISGDKSQCEGVIKALNCASVLVPFQNVIHNEFCKKEYDGLIEMHNFPLENHPEVDFYSSLTGEKIPMDSLSIAENSTKVCYKTVDFPAFAEKMSIKGFSTFVELGPNSTCTNWLKDTLNQQQHAACAIDKKGTSSIQSLYECLAQLISNGIDIDLSLLYPNTNQKQLKKHFTKKVKTGGSPVYDVLLSEDIQRQFTTVKRKEKSINITKNKGASQPITTKHTLEKIASMIDSSIRKKDPKTTVKIAENGLKLQDYNDPNHLKDKNVIYTKDDLIEFSEGKIGNVFGAEYNVIDQYKRRVMLPMDPYLLVSRVTGLDAKLGEYKPSTMQTEYDIPYNSGYATDTQIPWAVSVESGQCDLMLISYLGIDLENKGDYVYRLLDCTLEFIDDLPFEGQTLRYDISINSFVRNGRNLLFFFSYECFVEDRMVLKMTNGVAGFFTDEELSKGNGVVYTDSEKKVLAEVEKKKFIPFLTTKKTAFDIEDLRHLINGDAHKCFEDISYFPNGRNKSIRLAPEKMLMLDRIIKADVNGGVYGLGEVIAEKDLSPDDWYFPCHFRDDQVLAGSLQAEGGGNLLRFFMMMLGLQRLKKDARFQPIYGLQQKVRCRKEVTPNDKILTYRLVIKEIGLLPDPYVIGDLEIIVDGVITVHFANLGLQLREKDNPKYLEQPKKVTENVLLNETDIEIFALGRLADCFGPEYAVYDNRALSRQPNTDLQVVSRVIKIDGARFDFSKPTNIWTEYDVPQDVWYYKQNASMTVPYAILMEIALQPCGLLGAYLGSTLLFPDKDLYLRNLDGDGELLELPAGTDFRGKVVKNKSTLTSSTSLGGYVIQKYLFEVSVDEQVFYKGFSSFGFFPKEALAQQVGLDKGEDIPAWYVQNNLTTKDYFQIKLDSLYAKMKLYKENDKANNFRLAEDQLNLLDRGVVVKNGGEFGKGYIHCSKAIHTYDWFFTCHFYSDPVMPGSLGVEAISQAMQLFALQQDLGKDFNKPRFVQVENNKTEWKYRGQIRVNVENMHLEVHFKTIEKRGATLVLIANAYLWNEGTRIYQVTDLALGIQEA